MKIRTEIIMETPVPADQEGRTRELYGQEKATKRVLNKLREQAIEQFKAHGVNDIVTVSSKIVESNEESDKENKRYYFLTFTNTFSEEGHVESTMGNHVIDTHPVDWLRIFNADFAKQGEDRVYTLNFYEEIGKEQYDAWKSEFDAEDEMN